MLLPLLELSPLVLGVLVDCCLADFLVPSPLTPNIISLYLQYLPSPDVVFFSFGVVLGVLLLGGVDELGGVPEPEPLEFVFLQTSK